MKEKQYPVYLSRNDWQALMACALWQTTNRTDNMNPLWVVGKNRVMHIVGEISEAIAEKRDAATVSEGSK